jgi:hypothetical protein
VRRNKEQYAQAEARARTRHPVRPAYFDAFTDAAEMAIGGGFVRAIGMMTPPGINED